jgi:AraC-like DNA-binding protein
LIRATHLAIISAFVAVAAPAPLDIEAAYVFACTCQDALGVLAGGDDPLELLDAIHRALRACPEELSARYMSAIVGAVVSFGRQILRQIARIPLDDQRGSWSTADRVRSALRRVLAWHQRPGLTLSQIAGSLGVSVQYLSESINQLSHHGFRDHLHAIRVLHAAALLVETQDSVDAVARHVGYLTAPHLTRHFCSLLHVTPARFRILTYAKCQAVQRNPTEF